MSENKTQENKNQIDVNADANNLTDINNIPEYQASSLAARTGSQLFKQLKSQLSGSENRISPSKAIRLKCLDCCCGSTTEVMFCPCKDCSLWVFRFGRNPYSTRGSKSQNPDNIDDDDELP